MNGTKWLFCAIVLLRNYSLTHSLNHVSQDSCFIHASDARLHSPHLMYEPWMALNGFFVLLCC